MRGSIALVLMVLAGCNREPDFDERYDAANQQLGTTARQIEAELEKRAKAAEPSTSSPLQTPDPAQGSGSTPGKGA